jgi:bifunctional non-homologous end joining protein LigD
MPRSAARHSPVSAQLATIERRGGDGTLRFPGGATLAVTSLDKPYFPQDGITKGAVMRHYADVAPVLLPLLADRALALKRYPNGITGKSFYQQNPGADVPDDVRVETIDTEEGRAPRLVGGDLPTLLYGVQLGAIAIHPWHSRLPALDAPDYALLDLDPGTEAGLAGAVRVARLVGVQLSRWRLRAAVKTSGSTGLHIAIPLPRGATYGEATELTEDIATRIAREHPELATVERRLADRSPAAVYVDFLQNARGKTAASAFSVRARRMAPVSWPIAWREVAPRLRIERYTIGSVSAELAARAAARWTGVLRRRNTRAAFDAAG